MIISATSFVVVDLLIFGDELNFILNRELWDKLWDSVDGVSAWFFFNILAFWRGSNYHELWIDIHQENVICCIKENITADQ